MQSVRIFKTRTCRSDVQTSVARLRARLAGHGIELARTTWRAARIG
jgi:hypothetical protein